MDKKQKGAMARLFVMMLISAGLETGAVMMVMAVVQLILDPVALVEGETYQNICAMLNLRDLSHKQITEPTRLRRIY